MIEIIIDIIALATLFLSLIASISIVGFSLLLGIAPMPISKSGQAALLKNLPKIEKGEIFELGSGWGGLALRLAKHYPHLSIIGYERSFVPYWVSRLRQYLSQQKNVIFYKKNFYKVNFSSVSMAVCYLYPGAMVKLEEKFQNELLDSSFVVSFVFSLPKWSPKEVIEASDPFKSRIYFYQKPMWASLRA
jgi:hypothetical protein